MVRDVAISKGSELLPFSLFGLPSPFLEKDGISKHRLYQVRVHLRLRRIDHVLEELRLARVGVRSLDLLRYMDSFVGRRCAESF